MAGESLRVEYQELREEVVPERGPERRDLVPRAARLGTRVGRRLVAEVYAVAGDLGPADPVDDLYARQEPVELGRDVLPVEGRAVVGRVRVLRGEEAGADGAGRAAGGGRGGRALLDAELGLEDHAYAAGAEDHAGPPLVEGTGGVLDGGLRRGGAEGAEAGACGSCFD